jgi:membrane protease subunit HflK
MREEAEAYRNEVIARAEGEAERFEQLLKEYKKAPQITRDRLYLDMMEAVLSNSSKVMVDVEGGNNLLYLPLDKLMDRQTTGKTQVQQDAADIMEGIQQRAATMNNNQRARIESLRTRGTR